MKYFEELRIGGKVYYKPQPKQQAFHNAINNRDENGFRDFLYGGAARGGKAQYIKYPILTTDGWKTIETVNVGDYVFSNTGIPVMVVDKSEVDYEPTAFEIEFSTGEKFKCDANHLWRTFNCREREQLLRLSDAFRDKRKASRPSRAKDSDGLTHPWSQKIMTDMNKARGHVYKLAPTGTVRNTQELFETVYARGRRLNHSIFVTEPLVMPDKELPIEPYLFGVWLGDGFSGSGKIGMMIEDFEEMFYDNSLYSKIEQKKRDISFAIYRMFGLTEKLKTNNLINNKHIPSGYFISSYQQRLALLQGIMDTDGHCNKNGQCELGLSNKQLAHDVLSLISSLGIKTSMRIKKLSEKNPKHKDSYIVKFIAPMHVFKLARKKSRQRLVSSIQTRFRYIKSIKKCDPLPVQCITVANEDGMYLVGRTFIPTHNSFSMRWQIHKDCLENPRLRALLIRSSFPELERTHLASLMFDLPTEFGSYNSQKHSYRYSNDSVFDFGYGSSKEDFAQYLSTEYDIIAIDEGTTIPFKFSMLLRSRLTASRAGFTPYFMMATNPGGIAHVDVKNYFITKMVSKEEFPAYNPDEIFFIPATIYDNPLLMERDPDALKRLQQMSKKDQQKYLYGNWDIFEGQFFDEYHEDVHIIRPNEYLSYKDLLKMNCLAGFDYGRDNFVEFLASDYNNNIVVFDEWFNVGGTRSQKADSLKQFVYDRGLQSVEIIADTNLWIPDGFDVNFSASPAETFSDAGLKLTKVSKKSTDNRNYRILCNDSVKDALHWSAKDGEIVQPRLKIYQRCRRLRESLPLLITDTNDDQDIADDQYDHCFIAGTHITTRFGQTPIECIKVGDYVLTSHGYRQVLMTHKNYSRKVKDYLFNDGTSVQCTPSHPFKTKQKEFVAARDLTPYLSVSKNNIAGRYIWDIQLLSNLMVSSLDDTQNPNTESCAHIITAILRLASLVSKLCIGRYGKACMEKFREDIKSIILTVTLSTIVLRISPISHLPSILKLLSVNTIRKMQRRFGSIWKKSDLLQKNGTPAKREEDGTQNMRSILSSVIMEFTNVDIAEKTSRQKSNEQSSAQKSAATSGLGRQQIISYLNALTAAVNTLPTEMTKPSSVHIVVQENTHSVRRTVYNITVDDYPEYYANGLLVHNCYDAMKMGFQSLWKPNLPTADKDPDWVKYLLKKQQDSKTSFMGV